MSKKGGRNKIRSRSLQRLGKFFLMDEISQNIFNEELHELSGVKIHFGENYIWVSTRWRSRIWSEEIQNTHWLSHSVSLNLKDNNYWKPIRACSELEMKNRLQECYARSCQEIVGLRRRCCKEYNRVTRQWLNEFTLQHDQGHAQRVHCGIQFGNYKNGWNLL